MEIGDIINFLLVIAFAIIAPIIGLISKRSAKNKPGEIPQQKTQKSPQQGFDVLSEFFEKQMEKQEDPVYQDVKEAEASREEIIDEESAYYDNLKKNTDKLTNEKISLISNYKNKNKKVKSNLNRELVNNFDGRKAVIYSEILERKYF